MALNPLQLGQQGFDARKKYLSSVSSTPIKISPVAPGPMTMLPGTPGATAPAPTPTPSPAKEKYMASLSSDQPTVSSYQPTAVGGMSPITGNTQTPSGATVNATTGAMVQEAPRDPMASYRSAFDQYLQSLRPSDEETQARKYLSDLTLQSKRDYEKALESGETMGFASGEAARVNRNNSFAIEGAANAVDALTGNRSAMTEAQKARLEFEKTLIPQEKSMTDQYGTGAIGEYNFAKENGYQGSFTDYQNEDANRKKSIAAAGVSGGGSSSGVPGQLSALAQAVQRGTISIDKIPIAQRAAVAAELATSGIASTRQQALTYNLGVVNNLLNNPNLGSISGVPSLSAFIPGTSAQLTKNQYSQLKGILSLENRQLLQGSGAISDFEFKVLSDAATALGRNLSDEDFRTQLEAVRDVFEGKYAYTQAGSGAGATGQGQLSGTTSSGLGYTIIPD